jgi:hypothetical protein
LLRFRTPRGVLFKEGPTGAFITNAIRQFAGTQFDTGLAISGEQADFLWALQPTLLAAGWVHEPWRGAGLFVTQGKDRPLSGSVGATNVEIHIHPQSREKLLPAATALVAALNKMGIAATDAGFNTNSENVSAIHILIGDKQ